MISIDSHGVISSIGGTQSTVQGLKKATAIFIETSCQQGSCNTTKPFFVLTPKSPGGNLKLLEILKHIHLTHFWERENKAGWNPLPACIINTPKPLFVIFPKSAELGLKLLGRSQNFHISHFRERQEVRENKAGWNPLPAYIINTPKTLFVLSPKSTEGDLKPVSLNFKPASCNLQLLTKKYGTKTS